MTGLFCLICLVYSLYCFWDAWRKRDDVHIGNQAQNAVNVGVIFTFIGISIALYNFDTTKIATSIDAFLSGMKTAFYTSIIGMVFALIIKYVQSNNENRDSLEYKESLDNIKAIDDSVRNNTASVMAGLSEVKASIEAGSNEALGRELSALAASFNEFIEASKQTQASMTEIGSAIAAQTEKLDAVSAALQKSMEKFGDSQDKQIEAINAVMKENMGLLGDKIVSLNDSLSKQLQASGEKQIELLNSVNDSIGAMRAHSEKSAFDTAEMLKASKDYQAESLANEAKQNAILDANTQSIVGMKDAFDGFVNNVKEVFGEAVIGALNRSMQNLNDQLEKQFGENFKELNDAVKALNVWQSEYKEIVDESIKELKLLRDGFTHFETVVSENVNQHINSLNEGLQSFAQTSEKNVAIQQSLSEASGNLSQLVAEAQSNVEATKSVFNAFNDFSQEVTAQVNTSLDAHKNAVIESLNKLSDDVSLATQKNTEAIKLVSDASVEAMKSSADEFAGASKLAGEAAAKLTTDTEYFVGKFGKTSETVIKEIGETLEKFKVDFKSNADESIVVLEEVFRNVAESSAKEQDKAIKSLASNLAVISRQMIDNYNALISRIAQLDKLIAANGGRG